MTSILVLVGVSSYSPNLEMDTQDSFSAHPAIEHNIDDLAVLFPQILQTPGPLEVRQMRNPTSSDEIAGFLSSAAAAATDTLILYYAGHGVLSPIDGGLALTHSKTPRNQASYQSIDFSRVRGIFRQSRASSRIVLLDCCYSGSAANEVLDDGAITGQVAINGSYVMTSSSANRQSHVIPGERNSAFTGRLIQSLAKTASQDGKISTLNQLFYAVRVAMSADALPEPQALDSNGLGDTPIFNSINHTGVRTSSMGIGIEKTDERLNQDLVGVAPDLNEVDNREVVRRIRGARSIFFCAHTGYNAMVSQYQPAVRMALKTGCSIKAVVSDPHGPLMRSGELTRRLCPSIRQEGEIQDVIRTFSRHQKFTIDAGYPPENVQLRLYSGVPSMNVIRADGWMRVIPYLPLIDAAESPVFEYEFDTARPGRLTERYLQALRLLWDDSRPVDLSVYNVHADGPHTI